MNARTAMRTARRLPARSARTIVLFLALFVGGAGVGAVAPAAFGHGEAAVAQTHDEPTAAHQTAPSDSTPAMSQDCADEAPRVEAEPWARTELFFGTAKPDGTAVTEDEWRGFLDREITARFPDGLTVMTGIGQYRDADDKIVQEQSMLLILLYPQEAARDSGAKIEQIRDAYEQTFQQQSVLRADDSLPVCTSF